MSIKDAAGCSDTALKVQTLAQLAGGDDWRIGLAHDRPYHSLFWFIRGQGRILLDGRRRGIGPHNAVFIPAGALFSVELGRQSLGQVVTVPVGTPLRMPDMPWHLRVLDVQVPTKRSAGERLSREFVRLLSRHYTSGASLSFYAAELGVTPTNLTRVVKSATAKTAAELLTERVVHAARCLLKETNHPARNIAQHLGFGSAAYFTRFMQQHTGQSPSKLRKSEARAMHMPKPLKQTTIESAAD